MSETPNPCDLSLVERSFLFGEGDPRVKPKGIFSMNEAEAQRRLEQAIADEVERASDVQYEVVEQPGGVCDVVAWQGKTRLGVLARTKHRGIADVLVRALFAEGDEAEVA